MSASRAPRFRRTMCIGLSWAVFLGLLASRGMAANPFETNIRSWGSFQILDQPAVAVGAGSNLTLAVRQDGTVAGWGYSFWGQRSIPIGLDSVVAVDVGSYHCLALRRDGTVVAWGGKSMGKISSEAVVPPGLDSAVAIAAGDLHTVALRRDGSVVAWGWNEYAAPDIASGPADLVQFSVKASHMVGLRRDGRLGPLPRRTDPFLHSAARRRSGADLGRKGADAASGSRAGGLASVRTAAWSASRALVGGASFAHVRRDSPASVKRRETRDGICRG